MADKYVLFFNSENPPRGTRDNEMINQSLARFRRILLHEIEILAVAGVIIQLNGSVMQDGDLVNRLGAIPILEDPGTEVLSLNVRAPEEDHYEVLSDYITTVSGADAPVTPGVTLTILPAGEELSANIILKRGSIKSTNNVNFNPTSTITFYPIDSETDDFQFVVELVQGFSEEDFNGFLEQAYDLMGKEGGEITDESKLSNRENMKKRKYDILQSDVRSKMQHDKSFVDSVIGDY